MKQSPTSCGGFQGQSKKPHKGSQHTEPPAVTWRTVIRVPGPGLVWSDTQILSSRASGYLPQPGARCASSTFSQHAPGPSLTPLLLSIPQEGQGPHLQIAPVSSCPSQQHLPHLLSNHWGHLPVSSHALCSAVVRPSTLVGHKLEHL